jgi:hypothetical protein
MSGRNFIEVWRDDYKYLVPAPKTYTPSPSPMYTQPAIGTFN